MTEVAIALDIAKPIILDLVINEGYTLIPDLVPGEPLFVASEAIRFRTGDKEKFDVALEVLTNVLTPETITFETLNNRGIVGGASNQVAVGTHDHDLNSLVVLFENKII